ncbi:MAG: hypothetical protein HY246_09750 [Proteobacteria bacterium]|nr:hypothetical protein [Pseudomonadota bacterium]
MAIKKRAAILGFATLVVVLTGRSASADVIDGEWCTVDGRQHIEIKGPSIITPG